MKVYLAGPISGQSYEGCTDWRTYATTSLAARGIESIDPMRGKGYLAAQREVIKDCYSQFALSSAHAITTRDRWDCTRCDIVLANFTDATKVSIGTCIEIGWADSCRKPIVVVMTEDNPHWHGMIRDCAFIVVPTLDEAIQIIGNIAR